MEEIVGIAAGAIVLGSAAFFLGRKRVPQPPIDDDVIEATELRHQHTRWKKDIDTGIYSCIECGDRYLDGKPR